MHHFTGTRVITVEVGEVGREVVVRCVFRHTLSERCHVQLVSEVGGGFHQGGCVEEEEEGEGSLRFPSLLPATYTVLVHGLAGEEVYCSPGGGAPDYITVATVGGPHPTSTTSLTSLPSVTDQTGMQNKHSFTMTSPLFP